MILSLFTPADYLDSSLSSITWVIEQYNQQSTL
jgi:hypothetical protein